MGLFAGDTNIGNRGAPTRLDMLEHPSSSGQRPLDIGAIEIFNKEAKTAETFKRSGRVALRELFADTGGDGPAAVVNTENISGMIIDGIEYGAMEFRR